MKKITPFLLTPNPALLYLTPALKSVVHKIRYTIENKQGLTCLLGDVGMGKSSLIRLVYGEYLAREDSEVALIPNPNFTSDFGLFKAICEEFGLPPKNSMSNQEKELKKWLLKQFESDKNVVVFIDEAQVLTPKMFERVRTLLNIETNTTKLIQVVLAGQIELKERFAKKASKAINSRIFAPSTLDPLTLEETKAMIEYRCEREGVACPVPNELFVTIYNITSGIPRDILKLCDITYEIMHLSGENHFTKEMLDEVGKEYKYA